MLLGIIVSGLLGIVWWNLLIYYGFKSERIYTYIRKDGQLKETLDRAGNRLIRLVVLAAGIYLLVCDLIIFRFNPIGFPIVMVTNTLLILWLLLYNRIVINEWLLTRWKPRVLGLSKRMTSKSLAGYSRAISFYGFMVGLITGMVSAGLYMLIAQLMM